MDKILYVNGCSMTWGQDLSGVQPFEENKDHIQYRETHSWPTIIANDIGHTLVNESCPGGSNERVVRKTVNYVLSNSCNVVIIGWSGVKRKEVWSTIVNKYRDIIPEMIRGTSSFEKELIENYWTLTLNEEVLIAHTLHNMILLSKFLQSKNVTYLFFNALYSSENYFNGTIKKQDAEYKFLINEAFHNEFYYDEISFHEFAGNYPLGITKHPMEEAHSEWAKHLLKVIKDKNIV